MTNILIVYGTTKGHTAAIAERMREAIAGQGHEVTVERVGKSLPAIPDHVDGVLVGASVHAGRHPYGWDGAMARHRHKPVFGPIAR